MAAFLLVTDLDNTLVGDDVALEKLNQRLSQHRQIYGTKIVYSTGRSLISYQTLKAEKQLLDPDALVASVGTEIYYDDTMADPCISTMPALQHWQQRLALGWNREQTIDAASHFADLVPQPDSEQRPFKVSYFLTEAAAIDVLPQLKSLLKARGLEVKLVYSGGKDLDILPLNGDKGQAMLFLRQHWGIKAHQTVVCGDSGNDIALFAMGKERGILVGNSMPELRRWYAANPASYRYLAQANYAAGILEGLNYFGFLKEGNGEWAMGNGEP